MSNALVLKTDGTHLVEKWDNRNAYRTLSWGVGGYVECIELSEKELIMWINEEGKIFGLPTNYFATKIFAEEYGLVDVIVGDVVITGYVDDEGETLGLSDDELAKLIELIESW